MKLDAFFVCEQVVRRADNSMDVARFGIKNVNIPQLPAQIQLGVVCNISFTTAEIGDKIVKFILLPPDGRPLMEIQLVVTIRPNRTEWLQAGQMPLPFQVEGEHALIVTIDGNEVGRWPLAARLIHPALPPTAQ
jgi:hypothetical protein